MSKQNCLKIYIVIQRFLWLQLFLVSLKVNEISIDVKPGVLLQSASKLSHNLVFELPLYN